MTTEPRKRHHKKHGFKNSVRPLIQHVTGLDKLCYRVDKSFKALAADMIEIWIDDACDYFRPFLHGKKHTTLTTKDSHAYFQSLHHDLVTPKTHKATKSKGEKQSVSKTYGLILSVARVSNLMKANLGPAFTLRKNPDYFAVDMTWGFQARLARIFENFGKHHSASKAVRHTKAHLELFLSEYNNWNRETSDEKIAPSRLGAFRPHTKSTELKCKPSYTKKSASGKKAKKSASGKGGKRKAAPKKRKSASIKKEASIAQAIKVAEADAKRTVVAVEHIKHPTRVGARVRKTVDRYQG